ncbi:MAG: heme o synthase [Acidimicrobiales bacterium]
MEVTLTSHVPSGADSKINKARAYVALTKPRIIELLLVTTLPAMFLAREGIPSAGLMLGTLAGGTLASGGANAANMILDRDIDKLMERTKGRPLANGIVSPAGAAIFSAVLEVAAFACLWEVANLLAAVLALAGALFYLVVYTLWLKRTSPQNIVIGGAAGAVPVLVGWAAVTGSLSWTALVMFGIVFLWTPPHFWALALRYRDDYKAANIPMLPVVSSYESTALQMLIYTLALWICSIALVFVAHMGITYTVVAAIAGAAFAWQAWRLYRKLSGASPMRVFHWSITYLTLLFIAIALDVVIRHH